MAIEVRVSVRAGIADRALARITSVVLRVRLLSIAVLLSGSWAPIDSLSPAPADVRRLAERARALPPLSAAWGNAPRPAAWRAELIGIDLMRSTAPDVCAEPREPTEIDLASALRRAKPAPMALPRRESPSPPRRERETLDMRAITGPESTRADTPSRETTTTPGAYRILTRYVVGRTELCFVCDATRLGPGELLTAGHCLYQFDPNGDGDVSDAGWADQAWVWPAGLEPSAALPASRLAAHERWITRAAPDHDIGVVTVPALSPAPGPEDSDRK